MQQSGRVAIATEADIDAVWDVVRNVTRVGEWSHECVSASWLGGARSATPGARFRGRNRAHIFRWGRICEVVAADPYELVWRTVPSTLYPDSCEWRITLDEHDSCTVIEQSFETIRAPKVFVLLYGLIIPAHRDRTAALTDDLRRLGHVARHSATGHQVPTSTM
ncbi:MAG: SRPBCC family protein [Acidimicrobiia bacterium]|nr:SRPBCC family protein [Acidimicrobiia bacterium]